MDDAGPEASQQPWPKTFLTAALLVGVAASLLLWWGVRGALEQQQDHYRQMLQQQVQAALQYRIHESLTLLGTLAAAPEARLQPWLGAYPRFDLLFRARRQEDDWTLTQLASRGAEGPQSGWLADNPHWRTPLTRALETGSPRASPASMAGADSTHGTRVLLVQAGSGNEVLAARLDLNPLLAGLPHPKDTALRLFDLDSQSQQALYSTHPPQAWPGQERVAVGTLEVADRQWQLEVAIPGNGKARHKALLQGILVAALGLTLLVVLALARLYRRLQQAQAASARLENAWARDRSALQNKAIEKQVLSRALEDSEQRTRDYVSLYPGFAFEMDEEGRLGFISPQIHDCLGYPPAELAQCNLLDLMPEKERGRLRDSLTAARRDREPVRLDTFLNPAGGHEAIPLTFRFVAVVDPLNDCLGFRGLGWRRD